MTCQRHDELEPHEVERWAHSTTTGSVGRKAVLQYLAARSDERGSCFPGQQKIAKATEQGLRTINRHIADMEEAGLLCHHSRPRPDGKGRTSDRYFLHVDGECGRVDCPLFDALDQHANLAGWRPTNTPPETDQHATGGVRGTTSRTTSRKKSETGFPEGWKPNKNHAALASERSVDLREQAVQFEDHHRAKGSRYVNWDLAFNTWLRNASRWSKRPGGDDDYTPNVIRYRD